MYFYKSKVGLFTIRPIRDGFGLFIDDNLLGVYPSAVAAADDVYTHTTGCSEWDSLDGKVSPPTDVYEWQRS